MNLWWTELWSCMRVFYLYYTEEVISRLDLPRIVIHYNRNLGNLRKLQYTGGSYSKIWEARPHFRSNFLHFHAVFGKFWPSLQPVKRCKSNCSFQRVFFITELFSIVVKGIQFLPSHNKDDNRLLKMNL